MHDSEFEAMVAAAEEHWWYRGRRIVIDAALDRLELPGVPDILDVGCGDGRMLDELARRGAVTGIDVRPEAIAAARARGHARAHVALAEETGLASDAYDLVTAFDVVEHTPDDRRTLTELRRVTRPGGTLLITVPAYPSLWSQHDVVNDHYRRYTGRSLVAAATAAGWDVDHTTHFFAHLLAPAAAARWLQRLRPRDGQEPRSDLDHAGSRGVLARVLEAPSVAEAALIRSGRRIPMGLSLLAVLRAAPVSAAAPSQPEQPTALSARAGGRTRTRRRPPARSSAVPPAGGWTPARRAGHR